MSKLEHFESNADLNVSGRMITRLFVKTKDNKKYCIKIGIICGIVVIATIVLLVLIHMKKGKISLDNFHQTIELLIDEKEVGKTRYLQEEEKVQILGKNFSELNSNNTIIFLDDRKIAFDKYLFIKANSLVKVVIKFSGKITTFMEMFSDCNKIKEISLINVETDFISDTNSMFENCSSLTGVIFKNMSLYNITSTTKMFQNCPNLNFIDIEDFSTNKSKDMSKMFKGCSSLSNTSFIENL